MTIPAKRMKLVAGAFALAVLAGSILRSQQAGPQADVRDGEITGKVIAALDGRLLPGAIVTVQPESGDAGDERNVRTAVTGAGGAFRFTELPNGLYSVDVEKSGYQTKHNVYYRVTLSERAARSAVEFQMVRPAVVSGRVVEATGDSIEGARVSFIRRYFQHGQPFLSTFGHTLADDRGAFRLPAYRQGPEFLALCAEGPDAMQLASQGVQRFVPQCYPHTEDAGSLPLLPLSSDAEISGIEFRLRAAPETLAAGVIFSGRTGEPCDRCSWQVDQRVGSGWLRRLSGQGRDGSVTLRGLEPGEFRLVVEEWIDGGDSLAAVEPFQVLAGRPSELAVTTQPRGVLSGRVIFDGDAQKWTGGEGRISTASPGGIGGVSSDEGKFDPSHPEFRLESLPAGEHSIVASPPSGVAYVKAMYLGGRALRSRMVEIPSGGVLDGLEVQLAFDMAEVEGVVDPSPGEAQKGFGGVWLVPEGEAAIFGERIFGQVNSEGHIGPLKAPPGTYWVCALPPAAFPQPEDPEVQARAGPYAQRIRLEPNEKVSLKLTRVPEAAFR